MSTSGTDTSLLGSRLGERARQVLRRYREKRVERETAVLSGTDLAAMIDHTALKAETTPGAIDKLCAEARELRFASVCVSSCNVARCAEALKGSGIPVCSVVGFPLGAMISAAKAFETEEAIESGAREIDMVINIGALKAGDYVTVEEDIAAVVEVCHQRGALCKVIIEAAALSDEEKVAACLLILEAGADYSKTSTGFGPGGATVEDVALMRYVVGPDVGVKAAGGIRTYETAVAMVSAGASRIGASSGIQIVQGAPR